jgi:hypothetical protein
MPTTTPRACVPASRPWTRPGRRLSQIYHNAAIDTYLLSDKAGGDVEKLVFVKERLTMSMIDYSGFKYKSSISIGGPDY